jgi:hypothetical protein
MSGLTADVSTLQLLATTFAAFATETVSIETNLSAILAQWQNLETDVTAAVTDITSAISDASSADFAAVAADLTQAAADWQTSYGLASALSIQLNVNNAMLSVGMTSNQVSAALSAGQVMGVMDYYNRSAA